MKKFMTWSLLALSLTNAFAGDYFCQNVYKKKVDSLQKGINVIGWSAVTAVPTCLGTAAFSAGAAPIVCAALLGGMYAVVYIGDGVFFMPKLDSYLKAGSSVAESLFTREEYIFRQEEAVLKAQTEFRKQDPRNFTLKFQDFPEAMPYMMNLNPDNYLMPYDSSKAKTYIDSLVKELNQDNSRQLTYEQVSAVIKENSQDDTFCPKKKPLSYKAFRKTILKKLK